MDVSVGAPANGSLVGREADLARILAVFEAAASGQGHTILLSGEPGIGKTRLAQEVVFYTRRMGAQVYVGRAFEQHTTVPFFPFTEALTLDQTGAALSVSGETLERWPELRSLLPTWSEPPKRVDTESQLQVFRAATSFLHALSDMSPVVLLLEDMHWADTTSLSLLLYLCRHVTSARIVVLFTFRDAAVEWPQALQELVRELVRDRLADEVHLRRLAIDETAMLIGARLAGAVSDDLVRLVHSRAEGNPFFTEELLKALIERGFVAEVDGRWEANMREDFEVPRSVSSLIGQRVGRLPREVQELMRLASVLGQEFDLDVLLKVSGQPEPEVLNQLDGAHRAGVLEELLTGAVDRYRFAHALIQQTLYVELPGHRRRRLHKVVGQVLESDSTSRSLLLPELARHFLAGGDSPRATRYAIEAGDQAAGHYAHAEAARHYEVGIEGLLRLGDRTQAAGVQYRLARELYDLNRLAEAQSTYEASLATFADIGDNIGQARAHRGIGLLEDGRYNMASAVLHFDAALQSWPPELEDAELAALLVEASRAKDLSGDRTAAIALAERGLALAERIGESGLLARALARVSFTRTVLDPRPRSGIALLDRAEHYARPSANWRVLSRVYLSRAQQHALGGDFERALADRHREIEAADRSGEIERMAFAYHTVAETCLELGYWADGRAAARTGLALDPQQLLKGMPGEALLSWLDGRPLDALQQLRRFVAGARGRGDLQGVGLRLATLADLELQLNRVAEAEQSAREAFELLRVGGGWQPLPGSACGPLAETAVRLATPDEEELLAMAEHDVTATEQYRARPQLLRARGLFLQRRVELDAAVNVLAESAAVARSQNAAIQLGRTLHVLAAVARQNGDMMRAAETETELAELVERIGPEVRALAWARPAESSVKRVDNSSEPDQLATGPMKMLTRREREVAVLVAQGMTNHQIAEALVIADGTAGVHVDHILNKLGFRSRAQVAAWAVAQGLVIAPKNAEVRG
jgi:DNA-binding CsgD family transcriptional regulator/tetratricopeptide (TPR) repeat protein